MTKAWALVRRSLARSLELILWILSGIGLRLGTRLEVVFQIAIINALLWRLSCKQRRGVEVVPCRKPLSVGTLVRTLYLHNRLRCLRRISMSHCLSTRL